MTYEPLHHKYRPQTFAQLVGQDAIATTLSNALRQQRIAPAYLFTGPRGTGKTSSARILAKSLNCQAGEQPTDDPCGVCAICRAIAQGSALDVIEIDAASNTGVDNIRELIERAQFAPVQCRYKVYIIDEVHMLSTAAFNALLKTLEEPPDRVVFVLATTDPQRVLATIISRCQRFDFRRIALEAMVAHLSAIASKEAIAITPDAVQLVAQISQGGLRDAESLLDQLSLLEGEITVERVWELVGAVPERDLLALVEAIAQDNGAAVLDQARHLMNRGREPLIVLQNLASFYRDLLIAKTAGDRQDLVAITPSTWREMIALAQTLPIGTILHGQQHLRSSEVQVKNTTQPRLWLEMTLLGLLPSAIAIGAPKPQSSPGFFPTVARPPQIPESQTTKAPGGDRSTTPGAIAAPSPASPTPDSISTPTAAPPPASPTPTAAPAPDLEAPEPVAQLDEPLPVAEPGSKLVHQPKPAAPIPHATPINPTPVDRTPTPSGFAAYQQQKLDQIWQQVLVHVRPPFTQALFQQHGHLLALEGNTARVGIKAAPLMKMAEPRVANVEAAFAQVQGVPVRVRLEVKAVPEVESPAQPVSPPSPPAAPTPPPARHAALPPGQPPALPAGAPVIPPPPSEPPTSPGEISGATAPMSPSMAAGDRPSSELSPTPPTWQDEDEVTRAAKSFAQMFNGQIIDPDEDGLDLPPNGHSAGEPDGEDASRQPFSDNLDDLGDGDVPF
ncbi:MAG: DNA polymerase III subunit gamma/tau [Synechococcales bacterium]|nr:DNA polymerase III subunit gamma/tau [Synechococcales bacterium]